MEAPSSTWQLRYGDTRKGRAERMAISLPPRHPVGNFPPPSTLPNNPVTINGVSFFGHLEIMPNAQGATRRVRSQRVCETKPGWAVDDDVYYIVTLDYTRTTAIGCTCNDSGAWKCKHMLLVEQDAQAEVPPIQDSGFATLETQN